MNRKEGEGRDSEGEIEDRRIPPMASIRQQTKTNHRKRLLVLLELDNLDFSLLLISISMLCIIIKYVLFFV